MLSKLSYKLTNHFSSYIETLYQSSIQAQIPFFRVDSSQIQIIQDPLDFYLLLNNSIFQSTQKIGLSSLYLGTGALERHLLAKITARHKICPDLKSAMVFDHNRSIRQQKGQSPYNILTSFVQEVGTNATVSFLKIGKGKGVLGQVLGVHHQKIYLFDDRVILGGANLSHNYFLNRKDRYLSIMSPQLSDYLFEYIQILSQNPSQKQLKTHYKLWKFAHMPTEYKNSFQQQLLYLDNISLQRRKQKDRSFVWQRPQRQLSLSRNSQISEQIGSSLIKRQEVDPIKFTEARQEVRARLFTVGTQDYVGNQLQELGDPHSQPPALSGQQVYLFPFVQWPLLNQNHEISLFQKILSKASNEGHLLRLSSGYLNVDQQLFAKVLKQSKNTPAMELLCSAPQANSFYRAGFIKSRIPYMYRCFEHKLLSKIGQKVTIKEFFNDRWSFHAKGLWLQQSQNSYLTVVGSSNFNKRSKYRDTELQCYIYSGCKILNNRLNKQWKGIQKECKQIDVETIEKDPEIKVSLPYRILSGWLSSLL